MTFYLISISTLIGAVVQINIIGSRAFLVSQMNPIYAVWTGIIAGLINTLFFKYASSPTIKFAYYGAILSIIHAFISFLLPYLPISSEFMSLTWITFSALSVGICRWLTVEMAHKYLDPARAQSFFSYLSSFLGLGFILTYVIFTIFNLNLTPSETLITSGVLFTLISVLILFGFSPKHILEIKFEKIKSESEDLNKIEYKNLRFYFIILCFVMGGLKVIFGYLINIQLKNYLVTFEKINSTVINYSVVASILIIISGLVLGYLTTKKRISPIKIIVISKYTLIFFSLICLFFNQFELFIILEVVQKFIGQGVMTTSFQQIVNTFIDNHKKSFRSYHQLFYYTLTGPILGAIFYITNKLSFIIETRTLLIITVLISSIGIYSSYRFAFEFKNFLDKYLHSLSMTAKIFATQMLSFLRPKTFIETMKMELEKDQSNYLRKTMILGLGYSDDGQTVKIIKNQFKHEKEEIQIAVLNALSINQRFEGVSFIMDILNRKVLPKSFQVRVNATQIIAKIYDTKAIPLILVGLKDDDPRVIANVLETLSLFKNEGIVRYFIKFSNHDIARVKANALMGCYKYPQTRPLYNQIVGDIFDQHDQRLLPSIFYIIGRLRDKTFTSQLIKIAEQKIENIPITFRGPLAYALINLNKKRGYEIALDCFLVPYEENKEISFTHFLSQLTRIQRFDFIKNCFEVIGGPMSVKLHLSQSRFDFHEEVDYLNVLIAAKKFI